MVIHNCAGRKASVTFKDGSGVTKIVIAFENKFSHTMNVANGWPTTWISYKKTL